MDLRLGVHMELVRAFEAFGPLVGDPEVDRQREEAGRVLHAEICRISRALPASERFGEEAEHRVICALLRRGTESVARRPPATEEEVRRVLYWMLRYAAIDAWRGDSSRRLELESDDQAVEFAVAGGADPFESTALQRCRQELSQARDDLERTTFPALAAGMKGGGKTFLETIGWLHSLAAGTVTIDAVIHAVAAGGDPEAARVRFRQRVSAARERVTDWLDAPEERAAHHAHRLLAYELLIEELFDPARGR